MGLGQQATTRRRAGRAVALLALAAVAACGAEKQIGSANPTSTVPVGDLRLDTVPDTLVDSTIVVAGGGPGDSGTEDTQPADTQPAVTQPADTQPADTLAESTTSIAGAAVAGNSGGEGEGSTDPHSEVVREADGSCRGWAGSGDRGAWTSGLVAGATVRFLAKEDDTVIGTGTLDAGQAVNVGTDGNDQWMCTFAFRGEVRGNPGEFRIQVADLAPWLARPDPTNPGSFVASVSTDATTDEFLACTEPEYGDQVFEFSVVGQYWSDGIPSVCFAGLDVVEIRRPCRPPTIASDHVAAVLSYDDPAVVFEDESGFRGDVVATLAPGTKAIVVVVTGRPCAP
jgi:hypothetical protein